MGIPVGVGLPTTAVGIGVGDFLIVGVGEGVGAGLNVGVGVGDGVGVGLSVGVGLAVGTTTLGKVMATGIVRTEPGPVPMALTAATVKKKFKGLGVLMRFRSGLAIAT